MSKFFKALAQAERDRALRNGEPSAAELLPPALAPTAPRLDPSPMWPSPPIAEPAHDVDERLVSLVAPAAFEAEQYRALRHSVEHLHKTAGLRVVAVSSPCVGDGKSLTAINLAGALAQDPAARVLLVDADLRRPAAGRMLGLDPSARGLANAVVEPTIPLDRLIGRCPSFNLSVMCAGAAETNPYELLRSPRVGELLHALREQYDYVVLDTPPLTPVQDCRVLARWVDGFLVVVGALKTPRRFVEQALTILDRAKILGFIWNGEEDASLLGGDSHYYGGYFQGNNPLSQGRSGAVRRAIGSVLASLAPRR